MEVKGPGAADKSDPRKWEVASYIFTPSFVIVRQGDTVKLTAFLVNGDEHEVWVTAPDGRQITPCAATEVTRSQGGTRPVREPHENEAFEGC